MSDQTQNPGSQGPIGQGGAQGWNIGPSGQQGGFNPEQQGGRYAPPPPGAGFGGPFGPFPGAGSITPPPIPKEDNTPANYQIGQHLPKIINIKVPPHQLQFDEQYFLHLLAGSISLNRDEKKRIIDSIPRLKQAQIDELIRIFEEERRKFAELSAKHVPQLQKLEKQHWAEWQDLELEQKAEEKRSADEAQAEAIRKKLGL
jgi:hypothetical protein